MLDAAEELLSGGDARQVTIEKVIALSGATSGSFYARFGSVEGLFNALHQRYVDTIYQSTILEALNRGIEQPDLRKALHHIIKTMLEFGYKKRKLLAYFVGDPPLGCQKLACSFESAPRRSCPQRPSARK
jgi:AcrR family transcriptional regulator